VKPLEIQPLLRELRLEGDALFLASGATVSVWRVATTRGVFALRVTRADTREGVRMIADATLRSRLHGLGARVARSLEVGEWQGLEFALDEFVLGEHPENLEREVCVQLGETLAKLHALPCSGFGLLENRGDVLRGVERDPRAGVLSRLERPFPLVPLEENAVVRSTPEFLAQLRALESELLEVVHATPFTVNHSDLHGGQLLVYDAKLTALLDFGDACVGSSAWDIASFAFFHGWDNTAWLLEGYGLDRLAAAQRFCIVLCLHQLNRAVTQPKRKPRALERLRDTLKRLQKL
jgi:Ser/Thr protein kinase RdoA (MazF antagonist)